MSYSFALIESQLSEAVTAYGRKEHKLEFLIDAQLPRKLADFFNEKGISAIHTLDLPDKNATTDKYIKEMATKDNLVVITKDDDFLRSFLIEGKPSRLLLLKTGNISNKALMELFEKGFTVILSLIKYHSLVEITKEEIIVHE